MGIRFGLLLLIKTYCKHIIKELSQVVSSWIEGHKWKKWPYLSLVCLLCGGPLRCSSTSRSGIDTGILGRSLWRPPSGSPPRPGLVCTSCAASFPVWADRTACSGPDPRSPLVESLVARSTMAHYLSAWRERSQRYTGKTAGGGGGGAVDTSW